MKRYDIIFSLKTTNVAPNEGLVVLLCDLIKGLHGLGVQTRIFTSVRHDASLRQCFIDNKVANSAYEIRAFAVSPAVTAFFGERAQKRKREIREKKRLHRFLHGSRPIIRFIATLGVWQSIVLSLLILPLFVSMVFLILLLTPVLVALNSKNCRKVRLVKKRTKRRVRSWRDRLASSNLWIEMLDYAFEVEATRLIAQVNRHSDVRAVLISFLFVGRPLATLQAASIVVFPDIVTMRYPTRYKGQFTEKDYFRIAQSVACADRLICYSDHVATEHLRKHFSDHIGNKQVDVIPQGFFPIGAKTSSLYTNTIFFKNWFPEYCGFIPGYRMEDIVYVVYPSVDRAHKNMLVLLRAAEHLLRRKYTNIKIVTTSHCISQSTYEFIVEKRLFLDVLFTPSLDEGALNFLISEAALVVHPSLSEGGDVFNFSRAVSNGVPALLANIPVVREMFERYGVSSSVYGPWTFQPTDHLELAELISRSLQERRALYEAQVEVMKSLMSYDYAAMARRYLQVYEEAASQGPTHA